MFIFIGALLALMVVVYFAAFHPVGFDAAVARLRGFMPRPRP